MHSRQGFTLIEMLLVVALMGVMLAVVLPRAVRANNEAKFSQVRQYATEIASYTMQWAQSKTSSQPEDGPYTAKHFLMNHPDPELAGFATQPLVYQYTGSDNFNGVEKIIPSETMPKNPFNEVSYFSKVNDDTKAPSPKPGLLYLVTGLDSVGQGKDYRYFYFLFTFGESKGQPQWYGGIDHKNSDDIRNGVFVTRLPDSAATPGILLDTPDWTEQLYAHQNSGD